MKAEERKLEVLRKALRINVPELYFFYRDPDAVTGFE
jgi:hypothetical protein